MADATHQGLKERWIRRGFIAVLILLAAAGVLASVVYAGNEQSKQRYQQAVASLDAIYDSLPAIPKYWGAQEGPDTSTSFHLATKCVRDSVFFQFTVNPSRDVYDRYLRTVSSDKPPFTVDMLDSAGFRIARIPIPRDIILRAERGKDLTPSLEANDAASLKCSDYRLVGSWTPSWRIPK